MEATTDEVCEFLKGRDVDEAIIHTFRKNKVDGQVVSVMTAENLTSFGLRAIGDQILLWEFCSKQRESAEKKEADTSQKRKVQLLDLLRKGSSSKSTRLDTSDARPGRPKKTDRTINVGLRVLQRDVPTGRKAMAVRSPLGDQNYIKVILPCDTDYETLLTFCRERFFPNGINPVIQDINEFISFEIVNGLNINVRDDIPEIFTIETYVKKKMIAGSIRFYLLCSPGCFPDSDDEVPSMSIPDTDELPDLSDLTGGITHVPSSPSLEVLLRSDNDAVSSSDKGDEPFKVHIQRALDKTMESMIGCDDPVTILTKYQQNVMRGRPLNLLNESETIEGKSVDIFVDRHNLFTDAVEEILQADLDLSLPLNVQFIGERASDYGGPRREFLTVMTRVIREKLFESGSNGCTLLENEVYYQKRYFYAAGIFIGLGLLQEGPLPAFFEESQLQRIVNSDSEVRLTTAEAQMRGGLDQLGFIRIFREKPMVLHLLRNRTNMNISYGMLVKLLTPTFSENGSNRLQMEKKMYRIFLNYLKEVIAGRRDNRTLEDILRFTTGSRTEPVLGFGMGPSLTFCQGMQLLMPNSNTCINRITLPIEPILPDVDQIYTKFDIAFGMEYFGLV